MLRMSRVFLPTALAAALALAGCGHSSAPESAGPSPASSPVPAQSASPAANAASTSASTASNALPGDHAQTKRYKIDINYPQLPASDAVLAGALHQTGDKAKQEFMEALPDPKELPEFADRQLQLKVDFSVAARMPRFVSVREKGMADTGGAHPNPIDGSFVLDTQAGKVITLDDLFTDPEQARQHLSEISREALQKTLLAKVPGGAKTPAKVRKEWQDNMREMIDDGTRPTQENFSEFVVLAGAGDKASGLQLIFSPYQVAPYVYGTQTVDVPVDAIADLLKPAYRDAFDTGDSTTKGSN